MARSYDMKTFSERKGIKSVSQVIQVDSMSTELRNSLWNVLHLFFWNTEDFLYTDYGQSGIQKFSEKLWIFYFKKAVDQRPTNGQEILNEIRKYFHTCRWNEVYDFLEYIVKHHKKDRLNDAINYFLESELSGYRLVSGTVTDITSKQEVEMLEEALADTKFSAVSQHLRRALELLSDRKKPDYRNSIKESISAVESIAKMIANKPKVTLTQAFRELEKNGHKIHHALEAGFTKLYGYTSDEEGIRHSMLDDPNLSHADAKYFLLSCTSFVNYLKSKLPVKNSAK